MSEAGTGGTLLRLAAFGCGCSSAFGIEILGQLYWAEILLPVVTLILLVTKSPAGLFADRSFRVLMSTIVLMFIGYMISDLAAHTPTEMYLRGWARVAAFGSSAFSLCVICWNDRRCILWFCVGMAAGGITAGWMAGMPLTRWKLGYGEQAALLAASLGTFLPLWLASAGIAFVGGLSVLLDYRSLGVVLMLVAAGTFLRGTGVDLRRLWRTLPLLLLAGIAVAIVANWLLNASNEDNQLRRSVSNISRFAALRVGTIAIIDSPVLGYGSWGQGTEKYAEMLYEDTVGEMISEDAGDMLHRGHAFTAHSQLIQAWMEGGVLAASFFLAYMFHLLRGLIRCMYVRPADYLTPIILFILCGNLWAALMSPFLGSQRISIALAVAVITMLATERTESSAQDQELAGRNAAHRPVNLMT